MVMDTMDKKCMVMENKDQKAIVQREMDLADFYRLSASLTGYNQVQLRGTGVGESYFDVLTEIIPAQLLAQMNSAFCDVEQYDADAQNEQLRIQIMSSASLGPVARNIIKMWYCSTWYTLPTDWQSLYGKPTQTPGKYEVSTDFIVSEDAYIQGLAWDALKAHPMGAKQPGWADWAFPPKNSAVGANQKNIQIKQLEQ